MGYCRNFIVYVKEICYYLHKDRGRICPIGGCMDYKAVQDIGKETMEYIKRVLEPGMSLIEVRKLCEDN